MNLILFAAQLLAALLEAATAVIELVSLLKGRKSPESSEADTGGGSRGTRTALKRPLARN